MGPSGQARGGTWCPLLAVHVLSTCCFCFASFPDLRQVLLGSHPTWVWFGNCGTSGAALSCSP